MDYDHLQQICDEESAIIIEMLRNCPGRRLLEIGAGAGCQAAKFAEAGYDVSAVEVSGSQYLGRGKFPIIEYDGHRLPFADKTFDIIFSSGVLEHVPHLEEFQEETRRVLKKGGIALHMMPSGYWSFWTILTHYPVTFQNARKAKRWPSWSELRQHRHGARGSLLSEMRYFSRAWWKRFFVTHGWSIIRTRSNRVFYSGNHWFAAKISWEMRTKLRYLLGSSYNMFLLARDRETTPDFPPSPTPGAVQTVVQSAATHESDFDITPDVLAIRERVAPFTMTGLEAVSALLDAVRHIRRHRIPGAIVECGVWKGGSMMAVALELQSAGETDRDLWLYDTFEGMPEPGEVDVDHAGSKALDMFLENRTSPDASAWCDASIDEVRKNVTSTGYPTERIHLVKGKVEATIPAHAPDQIAILRLDTDWKESTAHELKHLYHRMPRGGIVIVDDYGYWRGARAAVDEFLATLGEPIFLQRVDKSVRMWIKL
jgi:SAM-dependent methyltransferase